VQILWFKNREADYFEFYKLWSSSAFKLVSEKKILCCGKDLMHRYGADGHVCKAKCMVKDGVLLSNIYVVMWQTHSYRKFEMVLRQVKLRSLWNIMNVQILRS
jgi:hypothetical protein